MAAITHHEKRPSMRLFQIAAAALTILPMGYPTMAQERIQISTDWGNVTAELEDNPAARALIQMLPITINMRDHLGQEKTGNLPSPLPEIAKQRDFAAGTLGLWGPDHFVIYYGSGRVPQPGIVILGKMTGDVSIFDRPGSVTVRLEREIDWDVSRSRHRELTLPPISV